MFHKYNKDFKLKTTIEFFPEEGKYYNDGHSNCKISFSPEETIKHNGLCPVCNKPLIKGVLYRINELKKNNKEHNILDYYSIAPLKMVISEAIKKGQVSKIVNNIYCSIIKKGYTEFEILICLKEDILDKILLDIKYKDLIKKAILDIRNKKVNKIPGYDGVFGKIELMKEK